MYILLEWLSLVGIILGIRIIIFCIAVSIDSLLTGVSTILTGRVTCDSHGFVYNDYVLLSISFDSQCDMTATDWLNLCMYCCQHHLTGNVT